MENPLTIAIFILSFIFPILIIVAVLFFSKRAEKKRTQEWQALAEEINFNFVEENNSIIDPYNHFKSFRSGHSKSVRNVLSGQNGDVDIEVFDYRYVTGSGKNRSVSELSICIMKVPHISFPNWFLRQEYFLFDYLGKLFGGQDINFDEDPEFSKSFVLQGHDEYIVRNLFTPEIRKKFLEFKGSLSCIEAQENIILIQQPRHKAKDITKLLDQAYQVKEIFS